MNQALLPGYLNFLMAWYNVRKLPEYQVLPEQDAISEAEWESAQDQALKYEFDEPSPSELLTIFGPECITIIKQNIKRLKRLENEVESLSSELFGKFLELIWGSEAPKELKEQQAKDAEELFYRRPIETIKKHIKSLSHLLKIDDWKRVPAGQHDITHNDIIRAKEYPLKDLLSVNRAGFALCPFHKEKTPSMKIFKDNRYHCFSCGADGDSIDFLMKRDQVDFINAVKKLAGC
jgi:hypothetical protein